MQRASSGLKADEKVFVGDFITTKLPKAVQTLDGHIANLSQYAYRHDISDIGPVISSLQSAKESVNQAIQHLESLVGGRKAVKESSGQGSTRGTRGTESEFTAEEIRSLKLLLSHLSVQQRVDDEQEDE